MFITDDIEISDDSDKENSDENSNKENLIQKLFIQ